MNISINRHPQPSPLRAAGPSPQLALMGRTLQMMMNLMMRLLQNRPGPTNGGGLSSGRPRFGGGAPVVKQSGMGRFLGGKSLEGPSASGGTVDPSQIQGQSAFGRTLAADAGRHANGPGGRCLQWVHNALERNGVKIPGKPSAYMVADDMAKHPRFREVKVRPSDLPRLPAGAVVVWNRGAGHPHGHISISLGNGREASDKNRKQITNYGTTVRVFLPK